MNIELMLVLVALLSVALCSISSDIISCPANVTTVSNFRTSLFAGTWFTQKMIPLPDDDPPARCLSQILIPLSIWQMEASFRLIDDMDDFQERTGTLIVEPKSRTILLYPGDRFRHAYDIIATDYNKFAITYSCRRLDSYLTIESGQVMTRIRVPEDDLLRRMDDELRKLNINPSHFRDLNQAKCLKYFPERNMSLIGE